MKAKVRQKRRSAESAAIVREVARDGSVGAVPGGVLRGGFGGSAEGWLTLLRSVSSILPLATLRASPTEAGGGRCPL